MQVCNDLVHEDSPSEDEAEDPWEVTVRLPGTLCSGALDANLIALLFHVYRKFSVEGSASRLRVNWILIFSLVLLGSHCCCKP